MMYNNKLVAVIKVDGKILREDKGVVYMPFGSEYSISFKNNNTTNVIVNVTVDGEDVLDGNTLVVDAGGDGHIEGFMKGYGVSHKFKFIEKTQEISNHRGDNISDGIVCIRFKYEKSLSIPQTVPLYRTPYGNDWSYGVYCSSVCDTSQTYDVTNEDGITVKGSSSDQSFHTTTVGVLENTEYSIVFQLKGIGVNGNVTKPILVNTKISCETCGKTNTSKNKFCFNCGTSLV